MKELFVVFRSPWRAHALWLALCLASILTATWRHPVPLDETRYLAVAWEMYSSGDWGIPRLDGAFYAQKPPLLFWLILLGWWFFGVNAAWPFLLEGGFALGTGVVLARLLQDWRVAHSPPQCLPDGAPAAWAVPFAVVTGVALLVACSFWLGMATTLYFDVPLTFFVVWAAWALWRMGQTGQGAVRFAAAVALGVLMKGPLMAIPLVGVVLGWPAWAQQGRRVWARVFLAGALGLLPALLWLAYLANREGASAVQEVLAAQGLGRLEEGADHAAPWWWYLAVLPLVLWPLAWWPGTWTAWRRGVALWREPPVRFILLAVVPAFVLLSLIAGKRPQYLLPLLPFVVALAAYGCWHVPAGARTVSARWRWLVVVPLLALALVCLVAPWVPRWQHDVAWLTPRWMLFGLGLILIAGGYLGWAWRQAMTLVPLAQEIPRLASLAAATVWLAQALLPWATDPAWDPSALGSRLRQWQAAGYALIWQGPRHHGAWTFAARLEAPLFSPAAEVPEGTPTVTLWLEKRRPEAVDDSCLAWRSDWVCWRIFAPGTKPD